MTNIQDLAPRAMFNEINNSSDCGIYGYHIQKKYVDPLRMVKERQYAKQKKGEKSRKYQTKRGNFLDDQANLHKLCPGPGTYKEQTLWSKQQKLKRNYADKMTYIDQIIKAQKRQKFPAPGTYNVVKTLKELQKQKKRLASKKITYKDKINYLDEIQFEATQTPGVGNYNPRVRAKTQTTNSKIVKKPQEWRKIHEVKGKKKPQKVPDMRTYNPVPSDYDLFSSVTDKKHNKNLLGRVQRFKTVSGGSGLPPFKYTVLQQWRGKDNGGVKKKQRHGLQSVSKGFSKSVYYN